MCSYPSPCDTCEKECNHKKGCDAWKIRTLTIWKQFNGYIKRRYRGVKKVQKFAYEHPDLLRLLCLVGCAAGVAEIHMGNGEMTMNFYDMTLDEEQQVFVEQILDLRKTLEG